MSSGAVGLPLATSTWDSSEYGALAEVIERGRFTMGPLVKEFEEEFAKFFGAEFAVMVNSGSSANLLAIAASVVDDEVDLAAGDEVLVPAVSWSTTFYPVSQYGLKLSFVDVDIDTLNIDLVKAAEAITPRTKAILAVNLLGNPVAAKALSSFAQSHGLLILEDNCEALGARSDGRYAGTVGAMGTFSTFFSHHISTMEGGVIVTDSERTAQILTSLRAHGWTRELPDKNHVHDKSGDPFDDLFRFVLPGYNVRPLEMSGALGLHQLQKVPTILEGRRENARYFQDRFGGLEDVRIQTEVGDSSWFGFSLILEGRLRGQRQRVVSALRDIGVESRPIVAGNFTRNPVMRYLDAVVPKSLPSADRVHDDGLFVGNHHYPVHEGIDLVFDALASIK